MKILTHERKYCHMQTAQDCHRTYVVNWMLWRRWPSSLEPLIDAIASTNTFGYHLDCFVYESFISNTRDG